MHLIITDPWFAKNRALYVSGLKIFTASAILFLFVIFIALVAYHSMAVYGAKRGWPIATSLANVVSSVERNSQESYLRENLDAMAVRLGEMQARVAAVDALAERLSAIAGIPPLDQKLRGGAAGGTLNSPQNLNAHDFATYIDLVARKSEANESRLSAVDSQFSFELFRNALVPTELPVREARSGSGFGWRIDPLSGQRAMHTGFDYPADIGVPIFAAAGGLVITQEYHQAYGNMLEIDHGKELVTRYAHASKTLVKVGDFVRRGQHIADVGTSGRSTGPHLHFEVWLGGVVQDPQLFLSAGNLLSENEVTLVKASSDR